MEFLLLGPLEVLAGRERIPLGGPRQRAVLADLLLHAGSIVSMDTLIDDLWGPEPPVTAEAVVQNAVSRLRKAMGRETIETSPPGYVLSVDSGAIDARRFERLARDSRPLPAAERAAALRDALALWRGPAFADLAFESFLQDEIARLDELRLTTLEDRLEAEIELGHHDAVIADASALATQHPARERLCRLLMLALNRAGRQQDALDAYETTRRALDELWGLEPAGETRALQVMILTQDPAIAVAPEVPRTIGAVRRPVALLLVELLLDEELELEAAGSALDDTRRALAEVAARHGGSLSPESGVELIAAFGAEGAHEDDVLRAARSAVELHEILRGREIDVRLAVGTGRLLVEDGRPVLVGAVVGQTRRALHEASAGEILVTSAASRLGGDALDLDADGRLLGVRTGRPRTTVEPARFVGRAAELEALRTALEQVGSTGCSRHVVVVGEAGIGKTRLVAAAFEDVEAVVLEAACVPYGEGTTFLPLRELADRAAALDPEDSELGELSSADAAFAAARTLVEHFTTSGPVVLVLDDMHWAVPTFLDLVEYVVRAVKGPLLVVSLTRPELLDQRSEWGAEAIRLGALFSADAAALVDALPERDVLDAKLAAAILAAAEGVPLFLEQMVWFAAESEVVADEIPPTIETLLASRIDVLEPGERDVLARAAIIGRTFSRVALEALTPDGERGELAGRLASLERRRLVRSTVGEHEFAHVLVQDAAYGAIRRADRAELHESFARRLELDGAEDELVGAHLERATIDTLHVGERAVLAREAAERLGQAGRRARLMLDHAAAQNLLERAGALLDDADHQRLELECLQCEALKAQGDGERAARLLESVAARALAAGDRRVELRSRTEQVWPRLLSGSLAAADAGELLADAVRELGQLGDSYGVARAEMTYALLRGNFENRADLAREHLDRAERAYRRVGVVGHTALAAVGHAVHGTTLVSDAIALCETAMARRPDHPREQAYLRHWLALLFALQNDLDRAREAAAQARLELSHLGEELALGTSAAGTFGSIEAAAESWHTARAVFEDALEYATSTGSTAWRAYFCARLGEVALGQGDVETAARRAEEARRLSPPDDAWTSVWWHRVAGRAFAALGRPRKAVRIAREAVTAADATDDLVMRGGARIDLAEVMLRTARPATAVETLREGLELLDRKGATLLSSRARVRFADALDEDVGGAGTNSRPHQRAHQQ